MSNDDNDSAAARAAEHYMRERYGASRGHPEWRALHDAFEAGYRAALAPVEADLETNALARMWERLAAHQRFADTRGYGDAWATMCRERTREAILQASHAAYAVQRAAPGAYRSALKAAKAALQAPMATNDAAYAEAQAAKAAARAAERGAKWAMRATATGLRYFDDETEMSAGRLAEAVISRIEKSEAADEPSGGRGADGRYL